MIHNTKQNGKKEKKNASNLLFCYFSVYFQHSCTITMTIGNQAEKKRKNRIQFDIGKYIDILLNNIFAQLHFHAEERNVLT